MIYVFLVLGLFSVSLGIIGIFLPVLPTTPFILLSMYFFSKSNKDFNEYVMNNKWFGKHIRNYYENRSMTKSFKIKTILFLWFGLSIAILLQANEIVKIVLGVIGILVTIHILLLKNHEK